MLSLRSSFGVRLISFSMLLSKCSISVWRRLPSILQAIPGRPSFRALVEDKENLLCGHGGESRKFTNRPCRPGAKAAKARLDRDGRHGDRDRQDGVVGVDAPA